MRPITCTAKSPNQTIIQKFHTDLIIIQQSRDEFETSIFKANANAKAGDLQGRGQWSSKPRRGKWPLRARPDQWCSSRPLSKEGSKANMAILYCTLKASLILFELEQTTKKLLRQR